MGQPASWGPHDSCWKSLEVSLTWWSLTDHTTGQTSTCLSCISHVWSCVLELIAWIILSQNHKRCSYHSLLILQFLILLCSVLLVVFLLCCVVLKLLFPHYHLVACHHSHHDQKPFLAVCLKFITDGFRDVDFAINDLSFQQCNPVWAIAISVFCLSPRMTSLVTIGGSWWLWLAESHKEMYVSILSLWRSYIACLFQQLFGLV